MNKKSDQRVIRRKLKINIYKRNYLKKENQKIVKQILRIYKKNKKKKYNRQNIILKFQKVKNKKNYKNKKEKKMRDKDKRKLENLKQKKNKNKNKIANYYQVMNQIEYQISIQPDITNCLFVFDQFSL